MKKSFYVYPQMNNILVFGAGGQLGHCLKDLAGKQGIDNIIFPDEAAANILDLGGLEKLFSEEKPAWVINCAAYTAVDKAEDETELAAKINRDGAENLAALCSKHHAVLVHVSTDFVFEGNTAKPLGETDPAKPVNVYGLTKLHGEEAIAKAMSRYFILRTSWLYSEYGNNFVKTMLRLGKEKEELKVIADQVGTPTYAMDLAGLIINIITSNSEKYGVYHYSNEGVASWYDFAKAIFDIAGINIRVLPVGTSEYVTKAVRPAFSVMDKSKTRKAFDITIPYWRDSLVKCIGILKASQDRV